MCLYDYYFTSYDMILLGMEAILNLPNMADTARAQLVSREKKGHSLAADYWSKFGASGTICTM